MPKSDKQTMQRRVADVERLLVMGAGLPEIRKYADSQGWNIGDRQLRRYFASANKNFSKAATRPRQQALGRHIKQREVLYAHALKEKDSRAALSALKDQAQLQGLYPRGSGATGARKDPDPFRDASRTSSMKRSERVARLIVAESHGDNAEIGLLEDAMPRKFYRVPDTMASLWQLHILSHCYLTEQLEQLGVFLYALRNADRDVDVRWRLLARMCAYRFHAAAEGWEKFTQLLGIDGAYLVRIHPQNALLELWRDRILAQAPSQTELKAEMRTARIEEPKLVTSADLANGWRRAFGNVDSS